MTPYVSTLSATFSWYGNIQALKLTKMDKYGKLF